MIQKYLIQTHRIDLFFTNKTFTLVTDDEKNVYLIKILSHNINEISKDNELKTSTH